MSGSLIFIPANFNSVLSKNIDKSNLHFIHCYQVGPLTTLERIECQCNHLTWFGSRVFVAPNKLHMDVIAIRILEPSNYAPVLAVLCVTFGLYFLVVIWARREDRKDRNKVFTGKKFTADPHHIFRYHWLSYI